MTVDCLPVDIEGNRSESWPWVQRAQEGDTEAFGLIYDRYVDTVFRFVYYRVGNRPLAEDLVSETFLRAFKRIQAFTWQGRDLGAWLVTIARNLVADHFKSSRYRLEISTGETHPFDQVDHSAEGNPAASVADHLTNVALLEAVKQLGPEQQECIVLRYLQGFSVAETAQAMGKNEGAVKALAYRAIRALARLLELADPADPSAGLVALTAEERPAPTPIVWAPPVQRWKPTEDQLPAAEPPLRLSPVDYSAAAIRAWARAEGIEVSQRGLVSAKLRKAYLEAHQAGVR